MKRNIFAIGCLMMGLLISGCGRSEQQNVEEAAYLTPDDVEKVCYMTEEELPNDMAYIVRTTTETIKDKDGNETKQDVTKYYPIYYGIEHNCSEQATFPAGENPDRIAWVNYNIDEGYIPTMYPGDKLIYKSSTYIPVKYSLEKFFDNGYTLGAAKFEQDTSGNYRFDKEEFGSITMSTSDAIGFSALEEIESIYLVSVGDQRVTPINMSESGTVTGLELMEKYECDIRQGTEKIDATLTCNIHMFSSAETYGFGSFTFITPHIAQLNIPDYVTTGYYNLNGIGFFRYVKEEGTDYHDLTAEDYNQTIYQYNEDGALVGTTIGLAFDENGFLVSTGYEEGNEEKPSTITHKTALLPDKNGYFSGEYMFTAVGDPVTSGNNYIYTVDAVNSENQEHLVFQYTLHPGENEIKMGEEYVVMFTRPADSFDGYVISYLSPVNAEATPVEPETDEIETEMETEMETEITEEAEATEE